MTEHPYADHVKLFTDAAGEWRWTAVAGNGEPVANGGEGYKNRGDAHDAVAALFPDSEILLAEHPAALDPADVKLGRLDVRVDPKTLMFANYIDDAVVLPTIPSSFTAVGTKVKSWPMYGNDRLGDCTCAAAGHMIQAWNAAALRFANPPTEQAIEHFYIPVTGSQDDGRVELDVLNAWRHTGIGTVPGLIDKIGAYVSVDPQNLAHVKAAIYLFGGVYTGIALPRSAQGQSEWKVVPGPNSQPGSWGGHAVPYFAFTKSTFTLCTWGELMRMTTGFHKEYTEECYAIISPDFINSAGETPQGFNMAALTADLAAL